MSLYISNDDKNRCKWTIANAFIEFQFSPDGLILHYLSIAFQAQNEEVTTARIVISAFYVGFGSQDADSNIKELKPCCDPIMATYQFDHALEKLPMPLTLTHWDIKFNTVYAVFPILSCSVKVIKIKLFNSDAVSLPVFQTLTRPIFIPCNSNYRAPKMLYQTSASKPDDSLYFVLNRSGGPANAEAGWPTVIRWTIPKADGWRLWDEDEDTKCEELKRDPTISLHQMVRGSFVEADKMFGVAIRGALDYTKRSFLSCY